MLATLLLLLMMPESALALDGLVVPEDLGYWRQSSTRPDGTNVTEYLDQKTGTKLRFWTDHARKAAVSETYDERDRLTFRETRLPGRIVTERLGPRGLEREELIPESDGQGGYIRIRDGKRERLPMTAFADGDSPCWRPQPVSAASFNDMLALKTPLLSFTDGATSGRYKDLGRNARARDCADYPPGAPNGANTLRAEAADALNTGLRCLTTKLAAKHPRGSRVGDIRVEMARLLAYFDPANSAHPFTFMCTHPPNRATCNWKENPNPPPLIPCLAQRMTASPINAIAISCSDPSSPERDAPGMILNVDELSKGTAASRKSTLFHEMLHMLGYNHTAAAQAEGHADFVYYAELCCFGDADIRSTACEVISKTPHEGRISL